MRNAKDYLTRLKLISENVEADRFINTTFLIKCQYRKSGALGININQFALLLINYNPSKA